MTTTIKFILENTNQILKRDPVRLFELDPNSMKIKTIHIFENVRHIHGVFYDNYTNKFWITTGDTDSESIIWRGG